jgi:hypothetical protein
VVAVGAGMVVETLIVVILLLAVAVEEDIRRLFFL